MRLIPYDSVPHTNSRLGYAFDIILVSGLLGDMLSVGGDWSYYVLIFPNKQNCWLFTGALSDVGDISCGFELQHLEK